MRSNGTPRRLATPSTNASRVNGVGSFIAVEMSASDTPASAASM